MLLDAGRSSLLAASSASSKRPGFASTQATFPPKNRVWGFEANPSGRSIARSLPRPKTTTGYRRDSYKIASGRPQWLSRDRLKNAERKQGWDLYWYVQNNPILKSDTFGLNSGIGTIGIVGLTSEDLGNLAASGVIASAACPPPKKCNKIDEQGRDGTLPHNSVKCLYDCNGKRGFKYITPTQKCPDNPEEKDIDIEE